MTLEQVLSEAERFPETAWLYLPRGEKWALRTPATVLQSDEVPEDEEDLPDAGVPEFAKANGLKQVLPISVIGDIMANLRSFRPSATPSEMLAAFEYCYLNDAFISE